MTDTPNQPPLSPAAQAVLDAFTASENGIYLEGDPDRIAAALRAAADQPYEVPYWVIGDSYWPYRNGIAAVRHQLLAIAAELKNAL